MKNIKFKVLSLMTIGILGLLASCENEEPTYPEIAPKPVATLSADKTTMPEFDNTATVDLENRATFTLTLDKASKVDIKYKITVLQSTGSGEDVIVNSPDSGIDNGVDGFLVTIARNTLSKTFTIDANEDVLPETTEKVMFSLEPAVELGGAVAENSKSFSLDLTNSTSPNLYVEFNWSGNYVDATGVGHDTGDYDMDLEIYDGGGNVVYDDYNNSPAVINFMSSQPNGTYDIVGSLWTATGPIAPSLPINFQTTFTVAKPGVFVKTYKFDNQWNSATGPFGNVSAASYKSPIYFVKTGTTYQVYESSTGDLLASGRMAKKIYKGGRK